jgi:hypothetical protein
MAAGGESECRRLAGVQDGALFLVLTILANVLLSGAASRKEWVGTSSLFRLRQGDRWRVEADRAYLG